MYHSLPFSRDHVVNYDHIMLILMTPGLGNPIGSFVQQQIVIITVKAESPSSRCPIGVIGGCIVHATL